MGHRILLVEDHHDTATAFARMLRRDGYDLTVAASSVDARALCAQQTFDLLICDINLGDGNGSELLKTARQSHEKTLGVIVSGHDDPAQKQQAKEAGFAQFFLKPIDYPSFRDALRALLARQ